MSVESSKARREAQNDLGDLQSEYAKKKRKYASEQEAQLADMKDYYNQRKEEVREQGDAAINHIRKKQGENVETINETRHRTAERAEKQINGIESDYRRKIAETRARRQEQIDATRADSQEKLEEIQSSQHQKVEKVRTDANQEIQDVKQRYNAELAHTKEFTDKRLNTVRDSNEKLVESEVAKGRVTQEKLQANQKKDYEAVSSAGEKKIQTRHDIQEAQYQRQDQEYAKRFESQKNQWDGREKATNEQYQNRIQNNKSAYEDQIKLQRKHFESSYQKNEVANRDALRIQEGNYLKEQVEMKKKFFKENDKYAGKEDDPFYKMSERGNRLRENPDFYIIEAFVPEHEKDSVKINIREDRASIAGKRLFKDEIEEEGRRLSTSNYQSFKEEFAFDKPVITEGMTRERNGDYVTFWVPKLNSFDGARKLSKKV